MSLLERYKKESLNVNEAKQVGTLYHVCTLDDYTYYIKPKDILKASGQYYNQQFDDYNCVSFTRDKGFVVDTYKNGELGEGRNGLVQLVIDGNKLSNNYKIVPYNDFFNREGDRRKQKIDPEDLEFEECVRGPIKNLSKYIKEIRFDFLTLRLEDIRDLVEAYNLHKLVFQPFNKRWKMSDRYVVADGGIDIPAELLIEDGYLEKGETLGEFIECYDDIKDRYCYIEEDDEYDEYDE